MLIGIIGAPNSGKSTFFKAITLKNVEIANYPFTTIKPNEGIGFVTSECPCKKLGIKCKPNNSKCIEGVRHIPVKLLDVAGLVEGASEGRGMGNQFLDDLRQASALIHVLDASGNTNADGKPATGWDPRQTVKVIENEIDQWIHGIIKKNLDKIKRLAIHEKKPLSRMIAEQLSGLGVDENNVKRALEKEEPETIEFATELRKQSKPIIIAANKIDLPEAQKNFESLKELGAIPCSAESELALKEAAIHRLIEYNSGGNSFKPIGNLNERQAEALEFIKKSVLDKYGSTGIQQCLNKIVFELLDMIVVYPVENESHFSDKQGNVLPDAILLKNGSNVHELAIKIHTEIGEKMIGAIDARTKMKIGREHRLKNGDIIKILLGK